MTIKIQNEEIKADMAYPYLAGMLFGKMTSLGIKAKSLKACLADENMSVETKLYMSNSLVEQLIEDFSESETTFESVHEQIMERIQKMKKELAEMRNSESN